VTGKHGALCLIQLQAILRGTNPICLAAIANYFSPNHMMMTSLSPELLSEFWKTCLNAAAHSLNIIFALREQNLIGKLKIFKPFPKLTTVRNIHVYGP
jgi:hypothetical protein